jgi:hypothetical protein
MRKPTPSQIKQSGILGEHFFTRATLEFYRQTMASFTTQWINKKEGVVLLSAPLAGESGNVIFMTRRYVQVCLDGSLVHISRARVENIQMLCSDIAE